MDASDELIKKRLTELAMRSYSQGVFTYSGFLDLHGLSLLAMIKNAISGVEYTAFGGADCCERKLVRFGSEALCGYSAGFPINCICVRPRSFKYSDSLTHRDFLGALMNLGVKRETLGDIFVCDNIGYVFCTQTVSQFILDTLTKVCRTDMECMLCDGIPDEAAPTLVSETVQLSGERLDALISKAYRLAREDSVELFRQKRVFINSAQCESISAKPKPGDVISVRGIGRFIYRGITGTSRKGKLIAMIDKYSG